MWNFFKSFFKTGLAVIGAPLVALSVMAASLVLIGAYSFEIATTSFKKAGFAKNLGNKDNEKHTDTTGAAIKEAMWGYIKGCAGLYTELGTEIKDLMNDTLDKSGRGSETPKDAEFSAIVRGETTKESVFDKKGENPTKFESTTNDKIHRSSIAPKGSPKKASGAKAFEKELELMKKENRNTGRG